MHKAATTDVFDLRGKVSVVTGGAGGIGLGMAKALARAGSDIALWDIRADRLDEAASQLREAGARVITSLVDVTQESSVAEAMATAIERLGRVDVTIAAAGILGEPCPFADSTLEGWRRVQAVNSEGCFLTLREAARHLVARAEAGDPGGSLIAVASIAAFNGTPRGEPYSASKAGVCALIRSLAVELARFGVRANAIAPGWIATEMTAEAQQQAAVQAKVLPRIPMRRWGTPDDLGGIAVYLASDASAYHSGDTLVIDGGYAIY